MRGRVHRCRTAGRLRYCLSVWRRAMSAQSVLLWSPRLTIRTHRSSHLTAALPCVNCNVQSCVTARLSTDRPHIRPHKGQSHRTRSVSIQVRVLQKSDLQTGPAFKLGPRPPRNLPTDVPIPQFLPMADHHSYQYAALGTTPQTANIDIYPARQQRRRWQQRRSRRPGRPGRCRHELGLA